MDAKKAWLSSGTPAAAAAVASCSSSVGCDGSSYDGCCVVCCADAS